MNDTDTIARAKVLLGSPDPDPLTAEDWSDAVAMAVTVDADGNLPFADDWTATYEPYWTAAQAADMLAVRASLTGRVTKFTSENTTIETAAPDWGAAAQKLRAQSPITALIAGVAGGQGFGVLIVPNDTPPYRHTSEGLS